jgi:predicted kinase
LRLCRAKFFAVKNQVHFYMKVCLIGLAGGSGAGKTWLASRLAQRLGAACARVSSVRPLRRRPSKKSNSASAPCKAGEAEESDSLNPY